MSRITNITGITDITGIAGGGNRLGYPIVSGTTIIGISDSATGHEFILSGRTVIGIQVGSAYGGFAAIMDGTAIVGMIQV